MELEARLLDAFVAAHPAQAARVFESMPASGSAEAMGDLPVATAAELLLRLTPLSAARSLELIPAERAALVLSATRRTAAATILRAMGRANRSTVLESLEPEARKALKPLLRYSEGTAGALMDPEVLSVVESASVGDALDRLRRSPQHALYYVYVVAEDQKLVGVVNMRELMEARLDELLGPIAVRAVESLPARASSDSIVVHPAWKRFHALPVIDTDGRFLGVVRYKSVRELEARFLETGFEDQGARTAEAVGELYGLGLRGMFESLVSALLGSDESQRVRR